MSTPATGGSAAGIPTDDIVLPFQIGPTGLRGRLVRLGPSVDAALRQHAYPYPVAVALAEMIALSAALSGTLKYDGVFTMQVKGDGPVRLMVADVTTGGHMRGYAQFDDPAVKALPERPSIPRLFGAGYLAFTVDQGPDTERYQGIVELTGATLAECAHHYFRQSEQFQAGLISAAAQVVDRDGAHWRAGALMLQRLPSEGAAGSAEGREVPRSFDALAEDAEDAWRAALMLASTATAADLTDPTLPAWRLVDRLFLAEGVKIFRPAQVEHRCRCSRERVASVLHSLPPAEIEDMKKEGRVEVRCEFCNTAHVFNESDLAAL